MVSKAMSGVKRPVLPDRERTSHGVKNRKKKFKKKRERERGGWRREKKKQREGEGLGKEKSVNCEDSNPAVSELFPKT